MEKKDISKNMKCAPNKAYQDDSCIPTNVLIEMAKAYNKTVNPTNQIKLDNGKDTLNPNGYKKYLISEFTKKLSNVCDKDQICWTRQNFVKLMNDKKLREDLKYNTFRPNGPEGQFTWLSTLDIDAVMAQYETKYKDFKFLGAVPIDFDELDGLGINKLNFDSLKRQGKTKIGIIFNLDEHYKSGSHWVSAFADLEKGQIYFSDSNGIRPEKRIRHFLRRTADYCQKAGATHLDIDYNKTRHQRENSECGVYSINFILRLLKGETFEQITSKRLADHKVNKCRSVYFNNANIKS